MARMTAYAWPGNVRELRNSIEYAFVLCPPKGLIDGAHLPPKITGHRPEGLEPASMDRSSSPALPPDPKREKLIQALHQANGNQSAAARILGVSRVTVWKQIKKYGVTVSREVARE